MRYRSRIPAASFRYLSMLTGSIALSILARAAAGDAASLPALSIDPFDPSNAVAQATAPADNGDAPPAAQPTPALTIDPTKQPVGASHTSDLAFMSIEDLMNIEVTSASKQKQRISDVAAAIHVITQEDIQRTHYQSIPELLRLAPGVNVQQLSPNTWTVGTRGFTSIFTDNLLVMVDGRSVYTPIFSGVYWNTVDYVMDDIDRIEVIRGPGATLWGANAVNGVISIMTKEAKDTQGLLVDSYLGTDGYVNSVRYGGKIGDIGYFRVYGKQRSMNDFQLASITPSVTIGDANDGWDQQRAGFRADLNLTPLDLLTVQGDYYNERSGSQVTLQTFTPPTFHATLTGPFNQDGGNVLMRWTHTFSADSDFSLQLYYDRMANAGRPLFNADLETDSVDVDFQHRFGLFGNQEIIWGGDYRFVAAHMSNSAGVGDWSRPHQDLTTASMFIQDDWTVVPDRLHLIAGTKVEYDSIVAGTFEAQPSIRAVWTPDAKNTIWASVSRAAKTPSLFEEDLSPIFARFLGPGPTEVRGLFNTDIQSIHMIAYEAGYRVQPVKQLSLDFAGFYDAYDNVRTFNPVGGIPPVNNGVTQIFAKYDDVQKAQTWGGEVAATWNVSDQFSLSGSYSFLSVLQFGPPAGMPSVPHADPVNQLKIQAHYAITKDIAADSQFYWVDRQIQANIPAYFRWDVSMTWAINKHFQLAGGVWNILDDHHGETPYGYAAPNVGEVPRTFFMQLQAKF